MSKTLEELAEELAEEFATDWHKDCDYPEVLLKSAKAATRTVFRAGYQTAKDQFADAKAAEGERMSDWTSIYGALPDTDEDVLWCNPHSGIVIVAPYNHKFDGELGEQYFTHWMLVPELPKVDK